MNLKTHVPLAAGILVIVLTQVLCAWWITRTIESTSVDERTVESIDRSLDRIDSNVGDMARIATR
jgi:hypothetical protein